MEGTQRRMRNDAKTPMTAILGQTIHLLLADRQNETDQTGNDGQRVKISSLIGKNLHQGCQHFQFEGHIHKM